MRILVVTQQLIPHEGGLSTHVVDLIAALRARGHAVELIHGGQAVLPRWARILRAAAVLGNRDRYRCASLGATIARLGQLVRARVGGFRPELIHCHEAYAGAAVAGVQAARGIPVVQTVHGPALYEHRQGARERPLVRYEAYILQCERTSFARAARIIAVDSGQAAILRNDYGVDGGRINVIFNSVNVEEVRELARRHAPMSVSPPFFLVPRRLVPKTGVRFAIEALARIPRDDVQLVIAGQGPQRAELEQLAASLGVAPRARFLGPVPRERLLPLFSQAAGVLVPSVPAAGVVEATSLAVMEAMACGSVAIASAIGGLAELIDDGETGLLVPPGDSAALAEAMRRIVDEVGLRERLVKAGTIKVERDYSTQAWIERVLEVYSLATGMTERDARRGGEC